MDPFTQLCSMLHGVVPSTVSEKKKAIPSSAFMNAIREHLGDTEDLPDELSGDQVDDTEHREESEEDEYEEDIGEQAGEDGEEFDVEME